MLGSEAEDTHSLFFTSSVTMKSDLTFLSFTFCIYKMKFIFTAEDSEKCFVKIKGLTNCS